MVMVKEFLSKADTKVYTMIPLTYDEIFEYTRYYLGAKILWYCSLCLNGDKFPAKEGNKIPRTVFTDVVLGITDYVLTVDVIKQFILFMPAPSFEVLNLLFENSNVSTIINERKEGLKHMGIIKILEELCLGNYASDEVKNAYSLFYGRISNSKFITISKKSCMVVVDRMLTSCAPFTSQKETYVGINQTQDYIIRLINSCTDLVSDDIEKLIKLALSTP
jgi:hypothetical protein